MTVQYNVDKSKMEKQEHLNPIIGKDATIVLLQSLHDGFIGLYADLSFCSCSFISRTHQL